MFIIITTCYLFSLLLLRVLFIIVVMVVVLLLLSSYKLLLLAVIVYLFIIIICLVVVLLLLVSGNTIITIYYYLLLCVIKRTISISRCSGCWYVVLVVIKLLVLFDVLYGGCLMCMFLCFMILIWVCTVFTLSCTWRLTEFVYVVVIMFHLNGTWFGSISISSVTNNIYIYHCLVVCCFVVRNILVLCVHMFSYW